MAEGTVKFFNEMKQFGFITGDDGKDYYVHASALKPGTTIAEGDKVKFEIAQGERGPKADQVEKL
jgi:CspA family cold shock protein